MGGYHRNILIEWRNLTWHDSCSGRDIESAGRSAGVEAAMQRWVLIRFACCAVLTASVLAGCGGGGPSILSTGSSGAATPQTNVQHMQISANTASAGSVSVGASFTLTPQVSGGNGAKLTFSVQNAASWMSFSTSTGVLSGTPAAADVGTYSNIVITVSDGGQRASTAPFTVTVLEANSATGSADVSWTPPSTNSDGSPLTNLAGYIIYYGTSAGALTQQVRVANPGLTSDMVTGLTNGTWYFAVAAYNTTGTASGLSNIASKIVS